MVSAAGWSSLRQLCGVDEFITIKLIFGFVNRTLLLIYLIIALSITWLPCNSQNVLSQLEFKDIDIGFPYYEYISKDFQGNYFIGVDLRSTDKDGLFMGDAFVPAFRHYPDDFNLGLSDFFLCKLSLDLTLKASFVIDNAETTRDIFAGESYTLISMSLIDTDVEKDSFPILLNGEFVLDREGNRGNGSLIVLDNELRFQKAIFLSDGELGQVAVEGNMAYLELQIPSNEPFIIVGGKDTVYNHTAFNNPNDYGRQTVVLCKYDLVTDEVIWLQRIGNVGFESLIEMEVDMDHNLVILGATSSVYFSFNDIDTILNYSDHNPFIGKYSPNGEFLLGILNQAEVSENAKDLYIDEENNYYITSNFYGKDFTIGDTLLLNPLYGNKYPIRAFVVKYNSTGAFQWISQIEGSFEESFLHGITGRNENIIISGIFNEGEAYFGSEVYSHDFDDGRENQFICVLDKETGRYRSHIMTEGNWHRHFFSLSVDQSGNLDMFMRFRGSDTIFNLPFSSSMNLWSGYLLKLSPDFLLSINNKSAHQDMISAYPNPCKSGDDILVKINAKQSIDPFICSIMDVKGEILWHSELLFDSFISIPTINLSQGAYWLKVQSEGSYDIQIILIQ